MVRKMNSGVVALCGVALPVSVGMAAAKEQGKKADMSDTKSKWKLVWGDEFDYKGLPDAKKWGYEEGFVRNQEMQFYMKACLKNSRVEDGRLIIEGHKERMPNPKVGKGWADWQKQRKFIDYTAASLVTQDTFSFTYGRVEVRAKMPRGKGMWPAIWTLGTNKTKVGWPRCGEIDIMEYVGKQPHTLHGTTHFGDPNKEGKGRAVHKSAGKGTIRIQNPWDDFHVYALEWDEKQIRWFVDGKQFTQLKTDVAGKGADNPFRKPHFLLINLAIGGSWGGPIDDSVLPQKYEIDYVRIFEAER